MVIGQDYWDKVNKVCSAGRAQSPIDIETKRVKSDSSLSLEMTSYDVPIDGHHFKLVNNGHTSQLELDTDGAQVKPIVTGSALDGKQYQFVQLHFHWHSSNDHGSEHAIDGKRYALEVSHCIKFRTQTRTA